MDGMTSSYLGKVHKTMVQAMVEAHITKSHVYDVDSRFEADLVRGKGNLTPTTGEYQSDFFYRKGLHHPPARSARGRKDLYCW